MKRGHVVARLELSAVGLSLEGYSFLQDLPELYCFLVRIHALQTGLELSFFSDENLVAPANTIYCTTSRNGAPLRTE